MSTEPLLLEASPVVRKFALVPARPSLGPPMMTGLLAGFAVALVAGMQGAGPLVAGLFTALVVATLSMRRMARTLPNEARLSDEALELARGDLVVRRVLFRNLAEVNQLPTPSGPLLYLGDDRQTLLLAKAQLVEGRRWEELSDGILRAVEFADPTGARARMAVRAGRLRDEIAHQPVRGVPALMGLVGLSSLMGFGAFQALAGRPFPRETLGALSAPLVRDEPWRLLAYTFQQESGLQLMLVLAGLLWLGSWLEKLLGWERVVVAFTAGTVAAGGAWVATGTPLPLVGGFSAIFGLFGAMGAVAVFGRKTLPRALLPRRGFWITTFVYVLIYLLVLPVFLSEGLGVDPVGRLAMWPTLLSKGAATVAGFLTTSALLAGGTLPARPSDRKASEPFAWLAVVALLIGLVGGVTHMKQKHPFDDEIVALSLLELPSESRAAQAQNYLSYMMLVTPGADIDTVDIAVRLAERAVVGTERKRPEVLDTLAVGLFKQGQTDDAMSLIDEALRLVEGDEKSDALRRFLEKRREEFRTGGPLSVEPGLFR